MPTDPAPVLVTGATGQQGGATARALLAAGVPVRALVRDPTTDRAKAVEALGAELVPGDLDDPASVVEAARGARAVFSVQTPLHAGGMDFDVELARGITLIEGALAAGVPQFVHSSVSGAGQHTATPGWAEGRWAPMQPYYTAKAGMQDRLRTAGFRYWTLLKPATFMENFLPSAAYMFPRGVEGGLVTVTKPATRISLVTVDDVGTAAAAAVAEPQRFHRVELELAGDLLTMTEIAAALSRALGVEVAAPDLTEQEAVAAGMAAWAATPHEMANVAGQPARPEYARALGIAVTPFETWAHRHLAAAALG